MLNENIKFLSGIANDFTNDGDINDIDKNKSEILFPFIEEVLGYDTINVGDVIVAPAYTDDGTFKLDYGLRSNKPNYYKSCFKVVARGVDFDEQIPDIKKCLTMAETEFIVVTDCFDYKFWVYDDTKDDLIAIGTYSLLNPESCDQSLLDLIHCPPDKKPKQEYAVRDDEDEFEDEDSEETDIDIYDEDEHDNIPKKKVIKSKKKNTKTITIICAIVVIILVVGIVGFLTRGANGRFFADLPIIGMQGGIDKGQLDGTLSLDASSGSSINIGFYSRNIPQGGVIKFEIVAGIFKESIYSTLGADGKTTASYAIPANWNEPNITVVAYLRFDEPSYAQPSSVKKVFGEVGEKIIGKDGAPDKFAITYGTLVYDNEAIRARLLEEERARAEQERLERMKTLGSLNIRMDAAGNWKILPDGYDMNESNITELVNIYPQIFYDGSKNQPYFYLICGTINQMQVVNFKTVMFYADGYEWVYDVNTNVYDISVNGGIAKEWVYFSSANIDDILNCAGFISNSEVSKITFVMGNKIKEHVLSETEKNNIRLMLAAYDKYFNTGSTPNKEWYVEYKEAKNPGQTSSSGKDTSTETNFALNYIKQPVRMLERDSEAEKELSELLNNIQDKRLRGETITAEEQTKLDIYINRYKILNDDLMNKIYLELSSASGVLSVDPKFDELKNGYYKIYFEYDGTNTKVESGYIQEIYILSDQRVYVPIKTVIGDNEAGYAVFNLSSSTYNDLLLFAATTDYAVIN